jgi:hypothetical protein
MTENLTSDDQDMSVREMISFLEHSLYTATQPYVYDMVAWHDYYLSAVSIAPLVATSDEPMQLSFSFMYENVEPTSGLVEQPVEETDLMAITREITDRF